MTPPRGLAEGVQKRSESDWASVYMPNNNGSKPHRRSGNRNRRRKGGRRLARGGHTGVVPAQPRTMVVKFDYHLNLTLTEAAAGIGESYVFRLNSLYDPNSTGVGSQPTGYDQWSALLERSVVYLCTVDLQMSNAGTQPQQMGCFAISGASPIPGATAWPSQYGAVSKLRAVTGNNIFALRRTYDIAKLLGVPRSRIFSEEDYSESPAGPAVAGNNQALLQIWVKGIGAVGVAAVSIKMTFHAKLFDPKSLAVS